MRTLLILNTGVGKNLGDRAMLCNMVRQLRAARPDWVLQVSANTPRFLVDEFQLTPVTFLIDCLGRWAPLLSALRLPRWLAQAAQWWLDIVSTAALLLWLLLAHPLRLRPHWRFMEADFVRSVLAADAIYLVGGGYLTDQGVRECRALLTTALFAAWLGKPIALSGQGLGPFHRPITHWLLRQVLGRARLIGLRDAGQGLRLLAELGIPTQQAETVCDDALTLPPAPASPAEARSLAVHWRVSPYQAETQRVQAILEALLDRFAADGWQIVLFQFHERPAYEAAIYQHWLNTRDWPRARLVQHADPRVLRAELARCQAGIGMAYHFCVFALAAGVPVLGLWHKRYYRDKLHGLFAAFGQASWAVDDRQIEADLLYLQLQNLAIRPTSSLQAQGQQLAERHRAWFARLLEALER